MILSLKVSLKYMRIIETTLFISDAAMELFLLIEGERMKVKCPYCGYEWDYKGKMFWASCPRCMRKFKVSQEVENNDRRD